MTTQQRITNLNMSTTAQACLDKSQLRNELDLFFRNAQPRAFRMLQFAVHDEQLALDLLQDAMLAFVRSYAQRPPAERAPLFYRVVQNRLRDHFRRHRVRSRWLSLFSDMGGRDKDDNNYQPEAIEPKPAAWRQLDTQHKLEYLDRVLSRLGARQQQTFLLRAWEGLTEAETATAMGISVGSVKTHYARARAALRKALGALGMAEFE